MDTNDDIPVKQRLRLVHLMDCVPGRALDPEHGEPIAILTLGYRGEVEQPMMFRLTDVRRLTAEFLCVLAEFEDETALAMYNKYVVTDSRRGRRILAGDGPALDVSTPQPAELGATTVAQPPATVPTQPGLVPTGTVMTVRLRDPDLKPITFAVLGGYRDGDQTYVILRCSELGEQAIDSIAKLGPDWTVNLKAQGDGVLPESMWTAFGVIPTGRGIMISGRVWTKIGKKELHRLFASHVYTIKS